MESILAPNFRVEFTLGPSYRSPKRQRPHPPPPPPPPLSELRDPAAAQGRKITYTNIGNPHAVGQRPITYYRQVLALCDLPDEFGIGNPRVASAFPPHAIDRARDMRAAMGPAGTGAYTNSQGMREFRDDVADFISERDGHASSSGDIFLTNGASSAIEHVSTGLIGNNRDAIMIPIPQYVSTMSRLIRFFSMWPLILPCSSTANLLGHHI